MNIQENIEFKDFVKDIKNRILSSQYEALKKVNRELINLYWDIGKDIEYKNNLKLHLLSREIGCYKTINELPSTLQEYLPSTIEIENSLIKFLESIDD
ncbi:hypothetical protein MNB_SV-15-357 [hydrothermal vent metagenome]|uniref:YhcG N-terminal domain-containing protein n=1 Tax=hydrothermal vent metagenome TaxID=652676 RepID=A0A1W1EHD9_9ZZZZ